MGKPIPWGISTIGCIYHPDCGAQLPDGRWVAAVGSPYPCNWRESIRAAWWVLTGRAHAFIWPKPGELEAFFRRETMVPRSSQRPFDYQERGQ